MPDRAADGSGKGEGGYLLIPAYPRTLAVPAKAVDEAPMIYN